ECFEDRCRGRIASSELAGKIARAGHSAPGEIGRMSRRQGVAGYILAGGESSRMGRDKALLVIGGAPLVGRTAALVALLTGPPTIIGAPERYESFGYRVIGDDAPGLGPLGGIATALRDSRESWNLIVGCDLPFLTNEWLAYLIDRALRSQADAVVPQSAAGA